MIKVKPEGESSEENALADEVDEPKKEPESVEEKKESGSDEKQSTPTGSSREDLEQRRSMLQSMKDFDFQIKKNSEDITKISDKIEGITKDLDDLVSLYEIVSEQMNPFVGLSKVTKKRIDALENFTQDLDIIKNRMEDVESVMEKKLGYVSNTYTKPSDDTIVEEKLDEPGDKDAELKSASEVSSDSKSSDEQVSPDDSQVVVEEPETMQTIAKPASVQSETASSGFSSGFDDSSDSMGFEVDSGSGMSMSDTQLDQILAKSLESFIAEQSIERVINDFLLSLK